MKPRCSGDMVEIDYTNHRGDRGKRKVIPIRLEFASSQWHPDPQWMLEAYDCGKKANRSFAMRDIHSWKPVE